MAEPMPVPELPETCQVDRIVDDFLAAVAAYSAGDGEAVANAIAPPDLGEVETYTRLVGLVTLAAHAVGAEHRKRYEPNPFGFYAVRIEELATGRAIDPDDSISAANVVATGRMLTAAANLDNTMLDSLIQAHMPFEGDIGRSGVLLDLIGIYCAMAGPGVPGA